MSEVAFGGPFQRQDDPLQRLSTRSSDVSPIALRIGTSPFGPVLSRAASTRRNPRSADRMCSRTFWSSEMSWISRGFQTLARSRNSPRYSPRPSCSAMPSIVFASAAASEPPSCTLAPSVAPFDLPKTFGRKPRAQPSGAAHFGSWETLLGRFRSSKSTHVGNQSKSCACSIWLHA